MYHKYIWVETEILFLGNFQLAFTRFSLQLMQQGRQQKQSQIYEAGVNVTRT